MSYPVALDEPRRLRALRELHDPSVPADAAFDALTALAAHICEAPTAFITLLEENRQCFRSQYGGVPGLRETPRELAFCNYTVLQSGLFVVPDARSDARFAEHPLVTGAPYVRFYAGAPLTTAEGCHIGALCVVDQVPRDLTPKQCAALEVLSHHVVTQLELQRSDRLRREAETELQRVNAELERRVEERTEALRQERHRLEVAIDAANVALWEWNIETGDAVQSAQWKAQLGFREDELPEGDVWRSLIHPDDLPRVIAELNKYMERPVGEYECEIRFRHKDGSYRWVLSRARLHYGPDGRPTRMLGCHIDLTDRRATEERLRNSREELRALAAHLQTVREEESTRMARELHDELGAALTGLKFDVAWMERQLVRVLPGPERAPLEERLRGLGENLDSTIDGVRKVCHTLRPAILELGLTAAIDWQVHEFTTRTGLRCDLQRPESVEMDPARATALFRILQELLTNVARHAQASQVRVVVQPADECLEMVVTDDGCGLPEDFCNRRGHFGLVGIRERTLAAGGTVHFSADPGAGTRVTVRIPFA